jgi:hypothetical protein
MMKVERDWPRQRVNIYLMTADNRAVVYGVPEERAARRFVPTQPGEEMPAFLSLSEEEWDQLASAMSEAPPPGPAVERHLQDAVKTRDRLFDLVEFYAQGGG